MKYIEYINMLNEALQRRLINAHEYTLYGAILAMFNAARWTGETMRISTSMLCDHTGLNKRTLTKCRAHLVELGMLMYERGSGGQDLPTYRLPDNRCKFAPDQCENAPVSGALSGALSGAKMHLPIYIEDKDKDNNFFHFVQKIGERDAQAREAVGDWLKSGEIIKNFADREGCTEEVAERILKQTLAEMIDGGIAIDRGFLPHLLNKARRKIPRPRGQATTGTQPPPSQPDYFATLRAKIINQDNAQ